jgi:hypothetical protein
MAINENAVTDTLTPTTGTLSVSGVFANNQTISVSTTIPSGYSAQSAGPITLASGVTVTIASGSRWVIL